METIDLLSIKLLTCFQVQQTQDMLAHWRENYLKQMLIKIISQSISFNGA